ncbi:hypothetical protein CANARDRAFT_26445 [[Candida] arabinofermentans NRRL YB-2248]|uniref:leucine--tRNA ligase n=1 Tax=[Candida] arabinofermentans NRRL YB-2248 TaxID=983967 RepID=A0A1E4T954_9ASCO|nr:hypothetical protein CANARDRAFT_26445 [[Candida] arabinofermentans NRRL YB-2248]
MSTEAKPVVLENTSRRDALIAIEKKYQKVWKDTNVFQVNAPTNEEVPYGTPLEELHEKHPKFFSTMAYPYMNGVLHAGHSFTLSKAEFSTGYEKLKGKRALFPIGFHCTGMPICASADKLKREVEMFGEDFSGVPSEEEEAELALKKQKEDEEKAANATKREDVTKFTAKKSKVAAKTGRSKYQFEIMQQLGIPKSEISKFADPYHWLTFFPPLVQDHVDNMGGKVDWRRSMITTDMNSYYDAFVRWQMNRLRELGKIKFGERYTIYSVKDGQPCMDHDRSSGEAVLPQEYTGIKIEVTEFAEEAQAVLKEANFDLTGKKVFLVAATLRPETMYGQTCCFVSPKINYGIFDAGEGNYYICTERSFKNMCYQKLTPTRGDYSSVLKIKGSTLVGSKIHAPLANYKELRILPMETVLETKGTGVVTCVPSDSPDDYVTTRDLYNKPEYYGIKQEWVVKDPVAIVKTEKYGEKCAEFLVNELKIASPKDANQLAKAKELAYKEGYYNGVLTVGKYAGEKVETAKPKVKKDLCESGDAFVYNEPESPVVSRSGDDCIVSLEDQWYLDYGEESWKAQAIECLEEMECFNPETKNAFEGVLNWLKNWAVSRTYGLGTRIPWDKKYLVESLSDSTVYHSYFTISHLLHSDFYGKEVGPLGITADQMTDDVWDYIFHRLDEYPECEISHDKLDLLRREFEYFYPLEESISGKDLIPNHLTFYIYCNVALFPKKFWPKGIRTNGHLMLNNAKMAKSTGNFMTLEQLVEKYGADATRIALADAGDTVEDANFDESNANAAILRMYNLKEWCEDIVKNSASLRTGEFNFFDKAFDNEMNSLIELTDSHYNATYFKAALKTGLFDYQYSRDYYRDVTTSLGCGMHKDLVLRYIETQALMLSPIAPHFCSYLFNEVLNKSENVNEIRWPKLSAPISKSTADALEYVRSLSRSIREAEGGLLKKKKGGKPADLNKDEPAILSLYISKSFPEWQDNYIELVRELFEAQKLEDTKAIREKIPGKDMKRAMPFISDLKKRLTSEKPEAVFNRELSFSEIDVVKTVLEVIKKAPSLTTVSQVRAIAFDSGASTGFDIVTGETVDIPNGKISEIAVPGEPAIGLKNI